MKHLIAAMALVISLTACGGADRTDSPPACTYQVETSPWGPCVAGKQSRTIVSLTESVLGCAPIPLLVQSCVAVCPPQAPLVCTTPTVTMCCPTGTPHYCASLNTCSSATTTCPELTFLCRQSSPGEY
jgi:hypothetical protein